MSDSLVNRLRGKYVMGPHLPNGKPEFGWKQFDATPINIEAADRIEELEKRNTSLKDLYNVCSYTLGLYFNAGVNDPEFHKAMRDLDQAYQEVDEE